MASSLALPRASLAVLCLLHAVVLAALAYFLPWPALTLFAILAGATAVGHLVTALLALVGSARRAMAWRITSLLSLGLLGYATYAVLGSGLYVNLLYQGVGTAIFAASIAAWCAGALFLLPLSVWGIAATGGLFGRRKNKAKVPPGAGAAVVIGLVLLATAVASEASAARGHEHLHLDDAELRQAVNDAFAAMPQRDAPKDATAPSLFFTSPVECAAPVHDDSRVTVFATFVEEKPGKEKPEHVASLICVQEPTLAAALEKTAATLSDRRAFGEVMVDVVVASRPLPDAGPFLGPVVVRPGIEGTCEEGRCLLPAQLFGLDAFTEAASISALQADIGVTSDVLRRLSKVEPGGFEGLDAFTTRTFRIAGSTSTSGETASVTPLRHLRAGPRPLDRATMEGSVRDAAGFVVSSQVKGGAFRYTVQPFSGVSSQANFSVPRQAGTTLSLCDAAAFHPKAKEAAKASLTFLVSLAQTNGELAGIVHPKGAKADASLGSTALTLVSLLACRPVVGNGFDETILRLAKTILTLQRKDGGFSPSWRPSTGQANPGKDPLYAAGQAVFALVLWEGPEGEGLERPAELKGAIDRAMAYYSGPYWNIPLYDFFFLEENWHCLAARAALTHHRNHAYEKFCIDYMTMKKRFIVRPSSGADEDSVGAYAFGHLFPPHHAAAAGFSEALAASIAVKRARKLPTDDDEQVLRWTLAYLVRHQWRDDNCQPCTKKLRVVGGFSENVASPIIRIDFVQHAMAGILHGSRVLGLLD